MEPHSEIQDVAKGCFLHRNRAICLVALALSVYLLISAVLKVAGPVSFPVHRTQLFLLGPAMGVWLLATLARRCNRIRERLFYVVWIGYFVIVGVRAGLPLSESAVRASDFLQVALGLAGIALSGAIALWHFRRKMQQADSTS
jgi:hypothetical protein